MKKLISLIIIFATTTIACMSTTMASFDVDNTMMNHNMMQNNISTSSNDCSKSMQWDCKEIDHECCLSPFENSGLSSNIHNSNLKKEYIKWKILDYDFYAILQENLENNYITKLNSPPTQEKEHLLTSFYITLTGSTKSNC